MPAQRIVIQGGEQFGLAAGDTIIHDTRRPYTLAFLSDTQQFLIDIPAAEPDAYWGVRVADPPSIIVPAGGVGAALGAELRRTLRNYLHDDSLALPACTHTLLRTLAQSGLRGPNARHLREPGLSPQDVARATGLSVRHLNRLFAREDSSLAEHIWAQRTAMAYRELVHPGARQTAVGEIAFRWGFSGQAHFSRTIAARYGAPPSVLRRRAQGYTFIK